MSSGPIGATVPDAGHLPRLTLAAVGCAVDGPFLVAAHRVARSPELGGDARVVGVAVQLRELAAFDPVRDLATELEVDPLVVDGPRLVGVHVDAVLGVADDLRECALARLEVDVGHPDDRQVLPTVGPHGAGRGEAEGRRGVAARGEVLEDAVLDQDGPLRRHALVVVRERAEPAGQCRVGDDRHLVASVAKCAPVLGREERRAGVRLLHAEDAVELGGVPDRLVHLQDHLRRVEHERRDLARALGCPQQVDGLAADALGFLCQAEGADVFVAGCPDMAAKRVRERPPLHLALADGGRLETAARVDDRLLDGRSVARGEVRAAPVEVDGGLGERHALHALRAAAGFHQQRDLLVQVDQERILLERRFPRRVHGLGVSQPDRLHGQARGGARDVGRECRRPGDLAVLRARGGREPPVAVHEDPDAEALREGAVDALHLLVPDG
jgi:hypothetical protein